MSDDGDPVVTYDDLSVHYTNQTSLAQAAPKFIRDRLSVEEPETVRAVDNVSLDIHENEVLAVVGESGCGKTTLGKVGVGLQEPTGGSIKYRGTDIWDAKRGDAPNGHDYAEIRRALQIIHQDPESAINPNQRIIETLKEPLRKWQPQMSEGERRERIISLLQRVGVTPAEDYIQRFPHQLSGGEQQRVVLCRALLMEPDLILADEAVSALDVSLRVEAMDLMLELQDMFNTSYIFISHNLSNARYFAGQADGRIAVMYLGKIVEIGPAREVVKNPQHPYTKVLKWATPDLDPDLAEEAMREDPPMRGIDIPDPVNPPSGCRFHTRCPEAREACAQALPDLVSNDGTTHKAACYIHEDEDHDYWNSEPLDPTTTGTLEQPQP
jgi:peptide/nickel transport system ATP-binding protein